MRGSPSAYHAYLLRLWHTRPDGRWRASLEDAQTGERIGFGSLDEVYAYLVATVEQTSNPHPQSTQRHGDQPR
jgi:hypothetical protein